MNALWTDLPPEIKAHFENKAVKKTYKRGEQIYNQGQDPQGIYFVKSGLIGLIILGAGSGKEHLLRFFKEGQFFGHRSFFAEEPYHASTVTLEPAVIEFINKDILLDVFSRNPGLYKNIVKVLAKELRRAEVQRVIILENQILARTAQALIYLKELHPDHNWTRQEIANFTASTVSTIIKALAQIEERGLIEQRGRTIKIKDRNGLIALQDSENLL